MAKPKAPKPLKKPRETPVQEEVTHLGVIINLMLQMDRKARGRVVDYLSNRFGDHGYY
jgi:hypothetical protein